MGIQFEHNLVLLLLLPLIGYIWWMWNCLHRLRGGRKAAVIVLRSILLIVLIMALAGAQWFTLQKSRHIVFALDRSDSVRDDNGVVNWLRNAAEQRTERDEAGVVAVGLDAVLEKALDERNMSGFEPAAQMNRQFSDLAAGLQLSSSLLPDHAGGRIVLISDGLENVGDMQRQGRLLRDRGIPVDVLALPVKERKDAAVESVRLPEKLYQAEQYTIEIMVRSTVSDLAVLRVYEDEHEITLQQVVLDKGENRFAVRGLAKDPGFHRYRAEVYMDSDELAANNTNYAFSRVQGPPKVLIVEGHPGISKNVESALQSALMSYDLIAPELLSNDFVTYSTYESIVLNNVPATAIPQKKMEMMEQAVRDYGVGLVMLGGENSFGLGGYFKTPIERALPVYMDLRGKREIPSLGLVIVMDKSGSMTGTKMSLAQEAASRTVDLLREKDTLGVLAFDSSPVWFVEPQKLTDKKAVISKINGIPADGGTEIYTAVQQGYEKLAKIEAQRKHIILLTDGQSATNQSYEALTELMQKDNITMSTVAIGSDADTYLLGRLAELAKGRFYAAIDETTIPAVFSREAVLISRTYVVNQPFTPAYNGGADWRAIFGGGIPELNGYIAATPKETAETILSSPEPDPILARWQYGSGRSAAWTSDVNGKWSSNWVSWPDFPKAIVQMIKWTFPQFQPTPLELAGKLEGNEATLEARSGSADFLGEMRAVITDEALQSREVRFTAIAPGEYSARLPIDKPGVYLAAAELYETGSDGEAPVGKLTTGFVIPYSPEYRITEQNGEERLKRLAEMTGGRVLSLERPEEVFAYEPTPSKKLTPIHMPLLIAALLLFLSDIAIRRVHLPQGMLTALISKLYRSNPSEGTKTAMNGKEGAFQRLNQRKEQAAISKNQSTAELIANTPAASIHPSIESALKAADAQAKPDGQSDAAANDSMNRLLAAKRRTRK